MSFLNIFVLIIFSSLHHHASSRIIKHEGTNRIVGGIEAEKAEFPSIVGLRKPDHYCGGSIINSEYVLSAAHCSQGLPSTYTVVAGDHINNQDEQTEQIRDVVQVINHPNYNAGTNENDIALLKISPPFEFNEFVKPIKLATNKFVPSERQIVAGWGLLTEDGTFPNVLMKVNVTFVTDEECRISYGERIKETMICAGDSEGGKDACTGDSGGPLMCFDSDNNKILCGVVSWGTGCGRQGKFGVYTEVSYYEDFISAVIK